MTTIIAINLEEAVVSQAVQVFLEESFQGHALRFVLSGKGVPKAHILITDDIGLTKKFKGTLCFFLATNDSLKSSKSILVLKKPFKIGALILPLKAALQLDPIFEIGNTNVCLSKMTKSLKDEKTGQTVMLTDKEVQIFEELYSNLDRVISKDQLLKEIWKYSEGIDSHTLETHIYRLRQKLDMFDQLKKKLVTQEEGYRLRSS